MQKKDTSSNPSKKAIHEQDKEPFKPNSNARNSHITIPNEAKETTKSGIEKGGTG